MIPTLDFAALDTVPLRSAVTVPGLEHPSLLAVLTAAMPGVQHSRKSLRTEVDEHTLIDLLTGSAVRVLISWDRQLGRTRTSIAEIGPRPLWDEVVAYLGEWERHSRTIPEHWGEQG
ncbi:hypothetical protein [Haloactinomyces albus]|uniref:Uncharacterized protein n=1 Tax=Haloactinomyces albus TaxID=1352928 RepID=A0AAE3ZJ60_9ACTN|nr:hypothetical protein [Haloactinomyces albus]MDR7303869.1 hypothetical protein [Haloactinomyces albus]